jgi:hypothetical protein
MNEHGHMAIAKIVNSQIGGRFLEQDLLRGSTDPDKGEVRSYRGDEYKHHFDNQSFGASRKDANDICRVVWFHALNARRYWLSGGADWSAFYFGVATHFLMDGLIVSPSVDTEQHARSDRAFAARAKKLKARRPNVDAEVDRVAAEQSLLNLMPSFGRNDPGSTDGAVQTLTTMALAVTAPRAPKAFVEAGQNICSQLQKESNALCQSYEAVVRGLAAKQIPVLAKVAEDKFQGSAFLRRSLAVDNAYKRLGVGNRSIASRAGCWAYRLAIRSCLSLTGLPAGLKTERRRHLNAFDAIRRKFDMQVGDVERSWSDQDGWFDLVSDPRQWRGLADQQASTRVAAELQNTKNARQTCRQAIEELAGRYALKALPQLPKWWIGTVRDEVGNGIRGSPVHKWALGFCGSLILCVLLGLCGLVWFGLTVAAIAAGVWPLMSLLVVCLLAHCEAMAEFARKGFSARCPKCSRQLWFWVGEMTNGSATCPSCRTTLAAELMQEESLTDEEYIEVDDTGS